MWWIEKHQNPNWKHYAISYFIQIKRNPTIICWFKNNFTKNFREYKLTKFKNPSSYTNTQNKWNNSKQDIHIAHYLKPLTKLASQYYTLKRKNAPVFPFGREHLCLIIPTEITSQLLDILGMGSYNNYREVSNDQILPLDISSFSSSDFEVWMVQAVFSITRIQKEV